MKNLLEMMVEINASVEKVDAMAYAVEGAMLDANNSAKWGPELARLNSLFYVLIDEIAQLKATVDEAQNGKEVA